MSQAFGLLLDILNVMFNETISEDNYHDLIDVMRVYCKTCQQITYMTKDEEIFELTSRGFPETYNPCEYMENLRFAFAFRAVSNVKASAYLAQLKQMLVCA